MGNREIIEAIASIAKEKNIERSELSDIIERLFLALIEKRYGTTDNFAVIVNVEKGELEIYHQKEVVEVVNDPVREISLEDARKVEPSLQIGDTYVDVVDPASFGRRLIIYAKQILNTQISKVEKSQIYEEFSKRVGQVINAEVYQIKRDAIYLKYEKAEMKMPREEQIPTERYRRGENLRVLVKEVRMGPGGPEIIVSRADNLFLQRLFEAEVPEIYDKTIEIKKIARHPGDRSKVVVYSSDKRIDPVGACVGLKGSRIQAIVRELNNEKIDIINYSSDPTLLIMRALSPAKPITLELDEERKHALAVFSDEEISVAIGKNGQNIKLASEVTGYTIDAMKKSDFDLSHSEIVYLEEIAGLSEREWKLLYSYGIETADAFLKTEKEELLKIKGLDEATIDRITPIIAEAQEKRLKEIEAAREAAKAKKEMEMEAVETPSAEAKEVEEEYEISEEDLIQDIES